MLRIFVNHQEIDLLPGTTIQIELNNPIFDAEEDFIKGSYSLPFTLPLSDQNRLIFHFPDVLDNTANLQREYQSYVVADGETILGTMTLRKIDTLRKTLTVNLQVGISTLGRKLKSKIYDFQYGGPRTLGDSLEAMRETMAHVSHYPDDSDFVFAPILNPQLGEVPEEVAKAFEKLIINDFQDNAFALPPPMRYTYGPRGACPFPKLHYVLQQIFKELGIRVEDRFFDEELKRLFIISNSGLEYINLINNYLYFSFGFKMADLLPEMTVIDVLRKLAVTFGLGIQVTLNNKLILTRLSDVIDSTDYVEMSHLTGPAHEQDIDEPEAYQLSYRLQADDEALKDKVADFSEVTIMPEVETKNELSNFHFSSGGAAPGQVRYVRQLNQWFIYKIDFASSRWEFYSENYAPVKSAGSEPKELEQGIPLVLVEPTDFHGNKVLLPQIKQDRYLPGCSLLKRSEELRLLFYRGHQPIGSGQFYPMLSWDNKNTQGNQVGEYSLRLDGAHGTHEKFLRKWLEFKSSIRPVRKFFHFEMVDFANLDLSRKINVHGNRYLIRKVTATLPLRQPVEMELVKTKI